MKGSDQAVFGVNKDDEITQYLTGRVIGPSEAVAMILSFPIHVRDPAVIRLQVHLPEQQRVYFEETDNVQLNENMAKTTLTEFMELCKKDPFARTLYYFEVPRYYTWANKCWKKER